MEQGICAMGESCLSPLPGQDGATRALGTEQGIHGMGESCLHMLPEAGSFQRAAVHGAGNPSKVQIRGAAACSALATGLPSLGMPLCHHGDPTSAGADATAALAHPTWLPGLAGPLPGTGQEQEPTLSALMETWKTICR